MTNHSEAMGTPENSDITGRSDLGPDAPDREGRRRDGRDGKGHDREEHGREGRGLKGRGREEGGREEGGREGWDAAVHQVTLRTPEELADALPYLLGYRPEDSIVLVALHDEGGRGRFGGRARLGIPPNPEDWPAVADQLARGLVTGGERRGARPAQMVAYLCQEPANGETGRRTMERLQPLAQQLRVACGRLDVPVIEALCICDGRFWSYCCAGKGCCPAEGAPMGLPGTSVIAAAATYAGIQVRGTLRELRSRLQPLETVAALEQEIALDTAGLALVPRILDESSRTSVADETLGLARQVMRRLTEAPLVPATREADCRDDGLLGPDEAAALILGLQDRVTRDRAAEWMEGDEAAPALRLWRALARRCVGPYGEHAAAPLTLAGWVAWSSGDELEAREALAMALGADPGYLFARLLHQACNEGLDPESVRRCLRAERTGRARPAALGAGEEPYREEAQTETVQTPTGVQTPEAVAAPTGVAVQTPERREEPESGEEPEMGEEPESGEEPEAGDETESGDEPEGLLPGPEPARGAPTARTPRPHPQKAHPTRPAAAGGARSRLRPAGKASARCRGARPEGARSDG
ncbi:hypothetical protein QFZ56_005680 [Streptomyces achromogenes]|uniref:DUF4192 domain-containing protein n=1 Tax=Streptomyces achromogenes TaxID=67255 RepID=A0ABU0Q7S9_STRAH|nr:DUF4192 domain-containing protein [Streptomyces achromogenes]MDQ0686717.1 hypothetical protein [Streptomyces achromogenes]